MTRRNSNDILNQIADEINHAARLLEQTEAAIAATPALDCGDLWSLFKSNNGAAWAALARLNERQLVLQAAAMSSFLFDHEDKLVSVEAILTTWRKRLAQRAAAQVEASPSDLPIPALGTLLDATEERAETARRQGDFEAAELLGEVWLNVLNGARLAWRRGDLVIYLSDTLTCPVSRDGCRWPGCASRAACWHAVLYDLLLDLQEDAAVTADARVWKEAA